MPITAAAFIAAARAHATANPHHRYQVDTNGDGSYITTHGVHACPTGRALAALGAPTHVLTDATRRSLTASRVLAALHVTGTTPTIRAWADRYQREYDCAVPLTEAITRADAAHPLPPEMTR